MAILDLIYPFAAPAVVAGAAAVALWAFHRRYTVAVPPNRALVLFGRRTAPDRRDLDHRSAPVVLRAPRIVVGGRAFVPPWDHGVGELALDAVATDVTVRSVHALEGTRASGWEIRLAVEAKVPAEPRLLATAAENLLGRSEDEVRAIVRRTVEGAVPALLARLGHDAGEPDWERLAAEVEASVATDLVRWGLVVRRLCVTELHRILPSEATPISVGKPGVPSPTAPVPPSLARTVGGLETRLARAERSLGVLGAELLRRSSDGPFAIDRVPAGSVFDLPLGYEATGDPDAGLDASASTHESMGGDRSPRPRAMPNGVGAEEGVRGLRPPLD